MFRLNRTPPRGPHLPDFHILSFEGPDPYSQAGGIASRVTGLAQALADCGARAHLWFVGDPDAGGEEVRDRVTLHRWCQWISRFHPSGVYDGEEGKRLDFARSLPPYLVQEWILPRLQEGDRRVVIMAEEWQTVDAVLHLDALLRQAGVRDRVALLWNANGSHGLDGIDWDALSRAARITTVSRTMRERMLRWGVEARVIANGVSPDAFEPLPVDALRRFREATLGRTVLTKVGRFVPEKNWLLAMETTASLRGVGWHPLLLARGGMEPHGGEVWERAQALGLRVGGRKVGDGRVGGLLDSLGELDDLDVLFLQEPLRPEACRLLYRGGDAVLANSRFEPSGRVGLEAMAAGGIACVGGSGEDYATSGYNALTLQTDDPGEFAAVYSPFREVPEAADELRARAIESARWYRWDEVVSGQLIPYLEALFPRGFSHPRPQSAPPLRPHRRRWGTPFLPQASQGLEQMGY